MPTPITRTLSHPSLCLCPEQARLPGQAETSLPWLLSCPEPASVQDRVYAELSSSALGVSHGPWLWLGHLASVLSRKCQQ